MVFAYPPYQFDAETPGHAGRALALLRPARLRAGRPGPGRERQHAGDVPGRGPGHRQGQRRRGDDRPRADPRVPLGIPEPQHSQGIVQLGVLPNGPAPTRRSIIGLNDFHGQLDPTTLAFDGINANVGGAASLATMFDEEASACPARTLLARRR